jgi:hypothetical protein
MLAVLLGSDMKGRRGEHKFAIAASPIPTIIHIFGPPNLARKIVTI